MKNTEQIAESIAKIIDNYIKRYDGDNYENGGRELLKEKLLHFIKNSEQITLVLPSFPFKSNNRDLTISSEPDLGEYLALSNLNSICELIRKIYSYGVRLIIASDGRLYSDLVFVSDRDVELYRARVMKINNRISKDSALVWYSLDDGLINHNCQNKDIREVLVEEYGISMNEVSDKIKTDSDYLRLYIGFKGFALGEIMAQNLQCSKRERIRKAKSIAENMMERNFANAKLLKENFPDMIRLSVKHHNTTKGIYGINLLPNHTDIGTPWLNSVVLTKDKSYAYRKSRECKDEGLILTDSNGLQYYKEN